MALADRRYLKVRRWVDRDAVEGLWSVAMTIAFFPVIVMSVATRYLVDPLRIIGWVLAIGLSGAWGVFVLWRYLRVYRAGIIEADRTYDQQVKFALPPEYSDTESAAHARRRERQDRTKKG